jgi:UDP-N-acetylglucosamine acyltransferase
MCTIRSASDASQPAGQVIMATIHATAIVDPKAHLDSRCRGRAIFDHRSQRASSARAPWSGRTWSSKATPPSAATTSSSSSRRSAPRRRTRSGTASRPAESATATPSASSAPSTPARCRTGVTSLGNDNWISAYVHLAHDCQVGSNTIFSNNAQLAGHVQSATGSIMSGFANVHQFCKIGAHAFVGMSTSLTQDVPPFVLLNGNPGRRARRQHRRPEAARLYARADQRHPRRLQDHLPLRPDAGRGQGRAAGRRRGQPGRRGAAHPCHARLPRRRQPWHRPLTARGRHRPCMVARRR